MSDILKKNDAALAAYRSAVSALPSEVEATVRVSIPRIKLLQPTSEEVKAGEKEGTWYHTGFGKSLGTDLAIVPLFFFPDRTFWLGDKLCCVSRNVVGKSKNVWRGETNRPELFGGENQPLCETCMYNREVAFMRTGGNIDVLQSSWCKFRYNFVVVPYPFNDPFIPGGLSFYSGTAQAGIDLMTFMGMSIEAGDPPFFMVYRFAIPKLRDFDKGKAYVTKTHLFMAIDGSERKKVEELYKTLLRGKVSLQEEEELNGSQL